MQPLGKERFAKFSRTSIFRYKFAHRFHQSTGYSLMGVEGFVWALMLNHEFMCSDLNWGCPAVPLWAWYWAALVSPSLAWRMLKSSCEDSWVVPWGHCPLLRAQTIPAEFTWQNGQCGGRGNTQTLFFLCAHEACPLQLGAAPGLNWGVCWSHSWGSGPAGEKAAELQP